MKKLILCGLLLAGTASLLGIDDFGRRYGANSFLFQLPLYFKDRLPRERDYNHKNKCHRCRPHYRCSRHQHNQEVAVNTAVIQEPHETRQDKKMANMRKKQEALSRKQSELQQEMNAIAMRIR